METCEYDFNRICRACKNETSDLCSVFNRSDDSGHNARLDEMLMACASIQVNMNVGCLTTITTQLLYLNKNFRNVLYKHTFLKSYVYLGL